MQFGPIHNSVIVWTDQESNVRLILFWIEVAIALVTSLLGANLHNLLHLSNATRSGISIKRYIDTTNY